MSFATLDSLWRNYLAARQELEVIGMWGDTSISERALEGVMRRTHGLAQELDDYLLNGPTDDNARLVWQLGVEVYERSGGQLTRKSLLPDEPFLMLIARFKALRMVHGARAARRIQGILLKMHDMHTDKRAKKIAHAIERSLRIVRF